LSGPLLTSLPGLRVGAGIVLVALWSTIGWGVAHRRRVQRELVKDDAVPAPAPRALLYVVLSAVVLAITGLMIYFLVS
jgi:hypothetical protein